MALKVLFISNAIYMFAALLLGPLYAVYVQGIGGGVLLVSVSTALSLIFVNNALLLILLQVLFGLGDALGTPIFGALFAKHTIKKEEVLEYSDWSLIANLVMALGTLIGGFIVSGLGFTFLFVTIGVLCFISAGWILFTPRKVL
ncbi:MAG: Major facilitator superfamily protein [Microgenomates group bacterium GW2011_GWC1_44_9]|nr:MAG: Major facilitator superfamily protein [Microgenomates group bacterium GW2011_GWC1_44_9]